MLDNHEPKYPSRLDVISILDDYSILRHKEYAVFYLWHHKCNRMIGLFNHLCWNCMEHIPIDVRVAASLMPTRSSKYGYN